MGREEDPKSGMPVQSRDVWGLLLPACESHALYWGTVLGYLCSKPEELGCLEPLRCGAALEDLLLAHGVWAWMRDFRTVLFGAGSVFIGAWK